MKVLSVSSNRRVEMIDITEDVSRAVEKMGVRNGIGCVYVPHTTAGVTINESADPSVAEDIQASLERLVPSSARYRHLEGNADAHVKASVVGSSISVIVEAGKLKLGTWQGIFFCEFDGPRKRKAYVEVYRSSSRGFMNKPRM
jgi:secondary thiamine-phosphate synthase enzyme